MCIYIHFSSDVICSVYGLFWHIDIVQVGGSAAHLLILVTEKFGHEILDGTV